jgi:hypothetical protein
MIFYIPSHNDKTEMHDCLSWCHDNTPHGYNFGWEKDFWVFEFPDEEDATAFKLKFGL